MGAEVDFMSKRSSGGRPSQTATSDQPGGGFGLRATSPDMTGDGPPNPLCCAHVRCVARRNRTENRVSCTVSISPEA